MNPKMVGVFEWPSFEAYQKLGKDPRMEKLFPIRNAAIEFFKTSFNNVPEDASITFREDRIYEFFAAWLKPNTEEKLKEYFAVSDPIKKRVGHPVFKTTFAPLKDQPNSDPFFVAHMGGLVEWPSKEDFHALFADDEFKTKAEPLLSEVVDHMNMFHTKFVFPDSGK